MRSLILCFSLLIATTFTIQSQSNDCAMATGLGAPDLTDGVTTVGATTADNTASGFWGVPAPLMDLTCDGTNTFLIDEWWRFDVVSGNDITIDIGGATTPMVAILEATTANCGTPNMNTFLGCMDASINASMTFENCFMAGGTYYIVVLTDVANQGPYDITVTEGGGTSGAALGDNCATAISLDPMIDGTDGTTITCGGNNVSGTTLNNFQEAKNDNLAQPPCIEANEATTWYSFTAGDDLYIENTISTDLSVAVYSGICGGLTFETCDNTGNIQLEDVLIAGNTYYIQVAYPYGSDGTFDICVNSPLMPTPDDCATAEMLTMTNGVTTSAVQLDNLGATSTGESFTPGLIAGCGTGSFSTVYYQFTLTDPNTHVNINYVQTGATPIDNSQITILADCSSATALNMYEWIGDTDEDICLAAGTYYIQVASCDIDEGTFTLDVTPNMPPANDECTSAIEFNDPISGLPVTEVPPICEVYSVSGTTEFACPETTNLGSTCDFDTESTVWYTFTTNAIATQEAEITLTPTGVNAIMNGTFALLTGPCDGTIVGTCQTDLTEANIVLSPGTQYYIAVSQDPAGATGTFDLELEISSIPTNDDCNLGTNPDILLATNGTTNCADFETATCMVSNATDDHQVFYIYSNASGATVDLEVTIEADIANGNAATQVSLTAFEDDCGLAAGFYTGALTNSEYCDILGAGVQTLPCIEDGETVILMFSSAEGDEGDFTISAVEAGMPPADGNDECTTALDITPLNTCEWVTVTVDNNNACPEDFGPEGVCNFNADPTVWFSFTVPAAAGTYTLEIEDIMDAGSYLTIYDSGIDCDMPGAPTLSADCETGAGPHDAYDDLTPGSTYLIAFGNPTEGIYSFDIKINLIPDNDECVDGVVLVGNTPTMGSTICASEEMTPYASGACADPDAEMNTVWYEITVGPGEKGFHLTVAGAGSNPITGGDINAVVFETTALGCVADGTTFEDDDCLAIGIESEEFECIGEGTYMIRISTSDANAGEFEITFEPIALIALNDNCDAPDGTLDTGAECEWIPATANTVGACPEDVFLDVTMCGLSTGAVVWYEATAPANATFLDLQINTDGGTNPFIAVFPGNPVDCDNQSFVAGSTCYQGVFDDLDALGENQIAITGGSTYLIAVGVTDPAGAAFDFGILWVTPPANDECVNAEVLTGGSTVNGTTACATQPIGGEYNSGVCTDADEENSVWYTYEVPATDKGFNVTINSSGVAGFMGDVNLVLFEPDPIGSCDVTAGTVVDEVCTGTGIINMEFECVGPGTYVIRVATSADNEGDFTIEITPLAIVQPNDFCDTPDLTAFNAQLECEWMTVDASTVDACPESFDFTNNCGFDDFPVTWYEVTAPADAEFIDLQINNGGINPFIGIFDSSIDCDNLSPLAGSDCFVGTFDDLDDLGVAQIPVTGGSTYLIGIGTNNAAGNIINFGIKWITPPVNDDCVDAIALTPGTPGADPGTFTTGPIAGTTQCATIALTGSACDDDKTNTVWYNYTVEADVKEITIDVTNWVNTVIPEGMPVFSVAVLDGCPPATFLTQADGTSADYCGGPGTDLITLSCLDEGDVITILVSSSSDNEGTFDITLNTAMPNCTYTNDECINAEPLTPTPLDTDEDCIIVAGCNDLACSDFNFAACAGIDQLNAVFYTFTTDADADEAFVNIEITNGEAGELDAPGAVLFNGDCVTPLSIGACGAGSGGEYTSGPLGGPGFIMANMTYTVMVFNSDATQNGGTFDLCVTVSSGCVNDEPCDAFTLEPNVTVVNPASSDNCTPEISISGCGNAFDEATLWYQVEVPEGFSYFEVTLVNGGVPDGVGEGLGEVSIAVGPLDDCNNIIPGDAIYTDCGGFTTNGGVHIIDCAIEYGTYYIQIGSEDGLDAGDFEITFTPVDDADPINDLCSMAEEVVVPDYCEFFPFPGDLKGACPELNDVNACLFSENSAVWYKITIPGGDPIVSDMDIEIEGLGNPILGVYEFDCSQVGEASMGIVSTPNLGDGTSAGCVEMNLAEGIVVMPGNEYYILVSSSTNEQSVFTLNIKLNAPPENDNPCINDINPPLDLTGGGSHTGTTCCARGPKDLNTDGTAADFTNVDCSIATEDAAVWYMYTPNPDDDGYQIILESAGAEGPVAIEIYTGPVDQGCNGGFGQTLESSCADFGVSFSIGNCFEPGDVLFVKVSTDDADENCGDFIITISPASCGPMADECIDLADETPIEPITPPNFDIEYFCVQGCLDYACPEDDAMGGCGEFVQNPTVWFQVTADDLAAQMFTYVTPNGNWDAVWSVYSGPDCDNLSVVNFGGSPPCSNGDDTPDLHQTSVFDDEENYWIAVTVDPGSIPSGGLEDGSFELCVATTINAIICLGELAGGACDDESLVMEVTDREIEDQPLEGPFCQGEEITINISFFYDASESGADWLIGFVPIFGNGWDLENFDYAQFAPTGNGQTAQWYEEDGDCAPILQEPNPILCTFEDADGNLQLCNLLCSPCSECPVPEMLEGDPLPSGYFWVSNGGNAGCDNDCSPGEGWGIGSTMAQIDWTFTLPVKEFDTYEDCLENNDLSISFQTFSDGTGGCWEDPVGECLLDRAMFSPAWEIECEAPPAVEGPDQELCHDGVTDIFVQTVDGSTNTIIVEVEDNPFVTGENNHTFPGGTGTIQDDLLNLTTDIQIVIYNVYSEDPTLPCPGVINQIEVTIHPELVATFPPTYVCEGECADITPDIFGGVGAPYTYSWSTGETTASINVCPLVPTTYSVTVEDALGCMDIAEVQVDVKPPVDVMLPESIDVCKDDNFDPFNPDYIVCLDFISGSSPFGITWNAPPGLEGSPGGAFGECFIINEQTSSEFVNDGVYTLSVTVIDFFGCQGETEMTVNITGELILVVDVFDLECGDTQATINATGFDAVGDPVTTFLLYGGCPDNGLGDFLEDCFNSGGVCTFPPVDLLDYTCYTIVAQTESGCQSTIDIEIPLTEGTPIDISGTPAVCLGEEATITIDNASDFTTFVWTPDIGSTGNITFTPDSSATYFVEATDMNGCNSQAVFSVAVNDQPVISMSGTTTFCEGGTASVTASGGVMYDWTSPTISGFPTTGQTITVGEPGEVTLMMTDANGCSSDTTITFTQENVITISLGDVNICDGMGDTVFVSTDFINVEWYDDTPTLVSDTTFYVITGAGMFTVQAIDGATGCDANGSFEVMDFMTPQISVSDTVEVCRIDSGIDSLCVDFSAQVTGSGGVWTQLDVIPGFTVDLSDLTNVCFEGAQTGCYAFEYTTNTAQTPPCENVSEIMMVCVKACPCPSPATQEIDPICNIGTTNLEFAEVTSDPGTWSVESGPTGQDITGILTGTIFNASGILPGDYVVRFTLDNPGQPPACEQFSEQTITVFAQPTITAMNANMCNIDNGTFPIVLDLFDLISVDASDGGTWVQIMDGAPMVTISGGSTIMSSDLSNFPETLTFEYTSSVEMGSPCPPAVVTVEVTILDCNCPFVDVLPDTLCNNGGLIDLNDLLINPEGLAGTWSTTGTLVGTDMFDPNGLPSGLYTITYTLDVSPGPTCDIAYSADILVRRQSVAVPTTAPPPCSVDTGNGPTTTNLYDWLEAGYSSGGWSQTGGTTLPFTDNGLDMAVVDFDGQPVGFMFVFTFTTIDAQTPCTNVSVDVTITVVDCNCPPIVLAPANDLCNLDGMLDLCALSVGSDPGTFTVASIGGTDFSDRISGDGCTFDATGLNPGEFVITYTLDQMVTGICEQFLETNFNVVQYLTSTIQDPPEVCSDPDGNGLMSLNFTTYVSNAGAGTWEDTDGAGVAIGTLSELQSVNFVNVPAGVYTFTYTIENDEPCEDVELTMEVSVTDDCNCPSILPLNPADECNTDGPIDLTQYDDPMRTGTWSSSDLTVENGNSVLIDGVLAGTYFLTYTIDDIVPDCDSTAVVEITIGEPANAGVPAEAFRLCEGDMEVIDLSSLLEGEDDMGVWTETSSNSSVGFDGTNVFTTDGDVAGTYTFEYTLSNNDPCPDVSSTVSVVIAPNPVSDAGEEKFIDCTTTVASLGGGGTSTGTEYEYTWVDTDTGEELGNTATIEVTNEGTYELTVLNTETGCVDVSSVLVMKSDDLPTMDIEAVNITCAGDDDGGLLITNQSGGDGNYTYTLGTIVTTDANDFATLPAGDYIIEIMDGIGCSQSYEFTINEPELLVVNAGPDLVGDLGETFDMTIEPFNTEGIASLLWTNFTTGDTLCNGLACTTLSVTPTEDVTTYYVEAIDSNGCVAFDEVQIQLQQIVDVIFPNIITPNGDNTNDVFYIKSGDVETVISMKIFDRWGEKIFDAENFPPRDPSYGWDGKFNEQKVVPGVFVFTVEVLFVNGDRETFSGDVTVTDSE